MTIVNQNKLGFLPSPFPKLSGAEQTVAFMTRMGERVGSGLNIACRSWTSVFPLFFEDGMRPGWQTRYLELHKSLSVALLPGLEDSLLGRLSQMSRFQTQQNLMAIVCSFQKKAHSSADF